MLWIDLVILGVIGFGVLFGFWRGALSQLIQIGNLIFAVGLTIFLFPRVGGWLEGAFDLPITLARPLSLIIIFAVSLSILQVVGRILQKLLAPVMQVNLPNRVAGAFLGGLRQTVLVSFVLAALVSLPLSASIKAKADESKLMSPLVRMALGFETFLSGWFKDDVLTSLGYRLISPDDTTTVALNFTVMDAKPIEEDELKLFALTNGVRKEANKSILLPHPGLQAVARAHAKDMLARGYFSHLAPPDSRDALDRARDAGVTVTAVGENLAQAPTVDVAQAGLMASKGHRETMLSEEFNAVGIAVLDAGKHGRMVVEVFAYVP